LKPPLDFILAALVVAAIYRQHFSMCDTDAEAVGNGEKSSQDLRRDWAHAHRIA
jgi:hypothetical protein